MKDFHVVGKKMTRNAGKMAKLIGCAFRFETEFTCDCVIMNTGKSDHNFCHSMTHILEKSYF